MVRMDESGMENIDDFKGKVEILIRVFQQASTDAFLDSYWKEDRTPGTVYPTYAPPVALALKRADMIPAKLTDLKSYLYGLKLRESSAMAWTNIMINSSSAMVGKLGETEDELADYGIVLFLQPIHECRTRVIGILPQLTTNSKLK